MGVPLDEERRGPLIPRLPPYNEVEVGSVIGLPVGTDGDIWHSVRVFDALGRRMLRAVTTAGDRG
jgi:hypothetical protein